MAMKKRLFAVLFLLVCSVAYASPLGDIIRNIDAASAKIFNFCTYNIEYKDGAKRRFFIAIHYKIALFLRVTYEKSPAKRGCSLLCFKMLRISNAISSCLSFR